jgi:membrane associated rhomboid family serine protease
VFGIRRATVSAMLSDRSYMRDDDTRHRPSVLAWLIGAIVAGFLLQVLLRSPLIGGDLFRPLALTVSGVREWRLWTLFTYNFLEDLPYVLVLVGNLFGLYFLGRELLPILGSRKFLGLYFGAILLSGLTWTLVHWSNGGMHYGATASVEALLVVFACFFPNQRMDFLLFFFIPVSAKPKHLALGLAAANLVGLLFFELPNAAHSGPTGIATSAHLGGMLAGWIYFRYLHEARWSFFSRGAEVELPRWMKRSAKAGSPAPGFQVNVGQRDNLRAEVDRILDKINSHGFGALTADEKRVLDEAKDLLSRR